MSYILDALRKADAERERDPARGIHAQPMASTAAPEGGKRPVAALLLGGAVVLAGAGAYAWWQREPAPVAPPAPMPVAVAPAPVPVPPAPAPVPAPVAVANVVQPAAPPMPAPAPEPVAKPQPAAKEAVAAKPAPAPAAAAPAADRVFAQAELPAELQRELPKLAITGGVHSDNASQRMLIVGGQVVGEGAELAPGLVLEQIRARTAVLRYKGYRYSVGY